MLRDLAANGDVIRDRMRRPGDGVEKTVAERSALEGMLRSQDAQAQVSSSTRRVVRDYMNWSRGLLDREAAMVGMRRQAVAGDEIEWSGGEMVAWLLLGRMVSMAGF